MVFNTLANRPRSSCPKRVTHAFKVPDDWTSQTRIALRDPRKKNPTPTSGSCCGRRWQEENNSRREVSIWFVSGTDLSLSGRCSGDGIDVPSLFSLRVVFCVFGVEVLLCSFILIHINICLESNKAGASMSQEHGESYVEKVFSNGDVYVGDFDGLLPHGLGIYAWVDGTTYNGQWEKSKITGRGKIHWPSGVTYEGELCGGFLHGSGTLFGVDGSIYKGQWRMSKQHGKGSKIYSNLDEYDGLWKEGLQEGSGTYRWTNGNAYSGNWKAGKMCGKGVMKWASGDLFDGDWLDGLENGSGCYRYADGSFYVGIWSRGLKDGHGTFFPSGSRLPCQLGYSEPVAYGNKAESLTPATLHSAEGPMNEMLPKRSRANTWSIIGCLRNSKRISHRSSSLDGIWNIGDIGGSSLSENTSHTLCSSSDEGQHELLDASVLVYDREYMQGVLITENVRYYDYEKPQRNKRHCMMRKQSKGPGETIYRGHRSYYLMLNLQLGIRYTVGKITPVPMREVRSSDFGDRARIRMYFPCSGSQFTPPHNSVGFFWKDYCPMVFRNLREMFKIDAADYMMSICGGDGLKELSSPGKSGSIFYLSQDERFVIKTLRKYELKILLKMLPNYYEHVGAYDNTLITKFFGLHRLTIKGRKVRFVVMGNMFRTELRIHRRYDLKGSSLGRSTSKHNINGNTTLKDLDLSYVFHLEKSWRESLFRQISLDCKFLESQSIIDYSMLLGLHFRAPEHLKAYSESPNLPKEIADSVDVNSGVHLHDEIRTPKGLCLVAHEPSSVSSLPGSHIRGSTLRASAAGNREVDLLLPGTARLRIQLGVNMPAQAHCQLFHSEGLDSTELDRVEFYDVVLYFGIIDILQQYNMTKKIEHACKSLKYDPLSISAIEPKMYSKRFISFLEKVFPE
ncbi:phosphatidylinositol 4-phosphate 5-kinase 1-like [Canna indica]|uniref:1-phosphatidylinositol-4-phosphate 5-kinase n=1 Tax=Canna indica TaxID=4628 RepID=A0AAQ3JWY6_9LILI|nr:phosphatidylinositol 4-phosphate 5-kinase 1-like [Canna indica]